MKVGTGRSTGSDIIIYRDNDTVTIVYGEQYVENLEFPDCGIITIHLQEGDA